MKKNEASKFAKNCIIPHNIIYSTYNCIETTQRLPFNKIRQIQNYKHKNIKNSKKLLN